MHRRRVTSETGRCTARRRPVLRPLLVAGALLAGAASLAGCAAARNELGTANSACYVDLPAAIHAVHHHGRLEGVRLVSVASLRRHAPRLYAAAQARSTRPSDVCLVAFSGRFRAAGVARPIGDSAGHLAVVELGYPHRRLLATLLVSHAPLPFSHFHL